jgi:hypothetical protein
MSETKTFILKTTKDLSLITDPIYQYFDKVKDEPLQVVVGRQSAFDKKTHPQLKYYHGVVLPTLEKLYLKTHQLPLQESDLALKFKAGYGEADLMVVIIDNRKIPIPYFKAKSKAEATILELGKLIDCAKEWAIELGGEIPEPTEVYENQGS